MPDLASNLSINKRLFFSRFDAEYLVSGTISDFAISEAADQLIVHLLPAHALGSGMLHDIKGRDRLNLINNSTPAGLQPNEDELFFIAGKRFLTPAAEDLAPLTEDFQLRLNTKFDRFEGQHHIEQRVEIERSGDLPDFVAPVHIARCFPLEIEWLRLGLEFFKSKRTSSMLTYTPVVTESLLIECHKNDFQLKITAESLPSHSALPLQSNSIIQTLDRVLSLLFGFDLISDYLRLAAAKA